MRMLRRLLWLTFASAMLAGCGAQTITPAGTGALPDIADLDSIAHAASETAPQVNGADYIASSGPPAVVPHPTQSTWVVLDGDQVADQTAWAIWRVTLNPGELPEAVDVNLPQNGLRRYWIAYADFAGERWQFLDTAGNELGLQGASAHIAPGTPGDLLSPNLNMYVAVIVRGGQSPSSAINVGYLEAGYMPAGGTDPIADDYEDNDTLDECYPLPDAGMYHASIHETWRVDMSDPNEFRDKYDFYCIDIPAGKELTVTLRHDAADHFGGQPGGYNDLDLLFYPESAEVWGEDFIEDDSSMQVFYGFEQIHLTGLSGMYKLGVVPDIGDDYAENAEYDLGVYFSSSTHSGSGKITQDGASVDKRFSVFLEPGNFNVPTVFDPGHEGEFTIDGVPDGPYTLKVQGSAGDNQTGYVYPESLSVTFSGTNLTGKNLDISLFPEP
jgi:hypothetical protein